MQRLRILATALLAVMAFLVSAAEVKAQPTFDLLLSPDTTAPGAQYMATYTIDNSAGGLVSDLGFTHGLPAGATLAAEPETTCANPVLAGTAGGAVLTLSDADLALGTVCTVSALLNAPAGIGPYVHTTGDLTSSAGNSGTASDTLTVATARPVFSMAFAPPSPTVGNRTRVTYTVDNTSNPGNSFNGTFQHALPPGVSVASPALVDTTCIASFTPTAGNTNVQAFSIFMAPGASCTLSVDLVAETPGTFLSITSDFSSTSGSSGLASATLTVGSGTTGGITFTKSFTDATVAPGGSTSLEFELSNIDRSDAATGVAFTDDLDAMLSGVISTGVESNTCGGSVTGTGLVSVSGVTLAPGGASCIIRIGVSVPSGAAPGRYANTTSALTGTLGGNPIAGGTATAELFVVGGPVLSKQFLTDPVLPGNTTSLEYTLTNPSSTDAMTVISFSDPYSGAFPETAITALPTAGFCGAGSFASNNTVAAPAELDFANLSLAAGASCTFEVEFTIPLGFAGGNYGFTTQDLQGTVGGSVVIGDNAFASVTVDDGGADIVVTKSVSGAAVPGGTVDVTYRIENPPESTVSATGIAFTDAIGTWVAGATVGAATTDTCGGTIGTGGTFSLSGGTVARDSFCEITVPMAVPVATSSGTYSQDSSQISYMASGNALTHPAVGVDLVVAGVTLDHAFIGSPAVAGGQMTLEYTITNDNPTQTATSIFFTHNLAGIISGFASTSGTVTDVCGAGSQITGTTFLIVVGGSLPPGGSCTFAVTVDVPVTAADASYASLTSALTYNEGGTPIAGPASSASFEVRTDSALEITKSLAAPSGRAGVPATVILTLENLRSGDPISGIAVDDDLDAFVTGATLTAIPNDTCGGTVAGTGTGLVQLSGITLAASASCSVTLTVDIPAGATPGLYTNTTTDIGGVIGALAVGGSAASADYQVLSATGPILSKTHNAAPVNRDGQLVANYQIALPGGAADIDQLSFIDPLGTTFPGLTLASTSAATNCGAATVSFVAGEVRFSGGTVSAAATCSFGLTFDLSGADAPATYNPSTGDLTSAGIKVGDAASAAVTLLPALPTLAKAFAPASITQGDVSTVTITVDAATSGGDVTGLGLTDALPAGMTIATPPNAASTCGGTLTATAGASSASFAGGTVTGGASCTLSFDVTTVTAGAAVNTTSALGTDFGSVAAASDTLTVTVPPPPGFAKAFTDASMPQGDVTTLTFTIDNSAAFIQATALGFVDNFPAGLVVADPPAASNACGGIFAPVAGANSVSFIGSGVAAGATCTLSVDVTSSVIGAKVNTTGDLTSDFGNSGPASDTLTITAAPAPTFAKVFGPDTIAQGDTSILTLTLDNSAALIEATNLAFTDTLPAGVTIADATAGTDCSGASLTATQGTSVISMTGGTLNAGASCTVTATVTSATTGAAVNTTGDLTSSLGNSGTATDTLTVTLAPAPVFTKVFGPDSLPQGGTSRLTFTIDNSAALIPVGSLAFTDTLPGSMVIASPADPGNTCAGTLTAVPGTNAIAYSGGTVATGLTCTVAVDVTSPDAGPLTNTSSALTSTQGSSAAASDVITFTPAPVPGVLLSLAQPNFAQGEETVLTIGIDNGAALVPASAMAFTLPLPTGTTVTDVASVSNSCGGVFSAPTGAATVSLTGGLVAAGTDCEISFGVTSTTIGANTSTLNLASNLGNSAGADVTVTVTPAPEPVFGATFAPDTIPQGGVTRITYTIDNSAAAIAATTAGFSQVFSAGTNVASPANVANGCGGTLTATSGTDTISLAGGSVPALGSCTIAVDVTSVPVGSRTEVSGALTTDLGNSGTASAALTVTAAGVPSFTKAFNPTSIPQGDVSTLTFTVDNSTALIPADNIAFTDALPGGMEVAATPNIGGTCGAGVLTGAAGATALSYAGGTAPASGSCTISVDVTSATLGDAVNTSSDMTSDLGNSGTASATLTVTAAPVHTATADFEFPTIVRGGLVDIRVTVTNPALIDAADIAFGIDLPANLDVAPGFATLNTCGGTITATAGGSSIGYAGGALTAGSNCEVAVQLIALGDGTVAAGPGSVVSTLGTATVADATLTITTPDVPAFAKSFSDAAIVQGDVTTLTFDIDNSAALVDATELAFTDAMPASMVVAAAPNISNTCGGTLDATAGSDTISLADGTATASGSCAISVDVTATDVGTLVNTTSTLGSEFGTGTTAGDSLDVTAAPLPTTSAAFDPMTVALGETARLTITIDNAAALVPLTGIGLTETLPSGLRVAPAFDPAVTCTAGTITATAGGTSFTFSGGEVAAGGSCEVSIVLQAGEIGSATTPGADFSSDAGSFSGAAATLTVDPAPVPTLTKSFADASIVQGGVTTLTIGVDNSAAAVPAGAISILDTFPAGLSVAAVPNLATTCTGGTLTGAAGATSVSYAGGSVAAGASCEVSVDVTSTTLGDAVNTTDPATSDLGTSSAATDTLSVILAPPPGFAASFSPDVVTEGGTTRLVYTISNLTGLVDATGLAFTTSLPANLPVATSPDVTNTCGGTVTATAGTNTLGLSGGTVGATASCTVSVAILGTLPGDYTVTSGALTSAFGNSGTASAALTVSTDPTGAVTFVQSTDTDGTFSFGSGEAALNFAITTSGGSGSFGPVNVTAGTYTITQTPPDGLGTTAISCNDDNSTADPASGVLTLVLDRLETVTCTFTSIDSRTETTDQITTFLNRRNTLLLTNRPSSGRRFERLSEGGDGVQRLSFQNGNLTSLLPFTMNFGALRQGDIQFSTSIAQAKAAHARFMLAHDGVDGGTYTIENSRWDVWAEGTFTRYDAGGDEGHFGLLYLGADYLVTGDLLVGALVQVDSMKDRSGASGSIDGRGWMAGPYVTARLAPNLFFDGRFAIGESTNDISPFGTYTDTFQTDRWLVDATLTGNFDWGNWVVSPAVSLAYIEETQHAYTDSLSVLIPTQTVSQGQLRLGPTFTTSFVGPNQMVIDPRLGLDAIYTFGDRNGAALSSGSPGDEVLGWRGRVEAGVTIRDTRGGRLEFGAHYDGIGQGDYEAWGASIKLSIPLQ